MMKHLLTMAIAAVCGLACPICEAAQVGQTSAPTQGTGASSANQFTSSVSDAYSRRLRRYQDNYGHNNNHYRNSSNNGYRTYDYYGGNYGRVRDYRNHYRSHPNNGYYNGYYSRPGFTIGGGSSRIFFGF